MGSYPFNPTFTPGSRFEVVPRLATQGDSVIRDALPLFHGPCSLFLFQEQRRFLAQYWKKVVCYLRQEPRQRHFDAQRVLQHLNGSRCSLTERAHAEAERVFFPGLMLDRDHLSEVTLCAGEALFETADSLDLTDTMRDDDCDAIAHGNCACVAWTCMRAPDPSFYFR
jgi:hypothetical protein